MAFQLYAKNGARLSYIKSAGDKSYNWIFVPGGPGFDSGYYLSLINLLNLPGTVWLLDLMENGSNKDGEYDPNFDFERWEQDLEEILSSFDRVIYVGHSFSGKYALLLPQIEKYLSALVLMCCSPVPWVNKTAVQGEKNQLPAFDKELSEFLQVKNKETFDKLLNVFAHYYFPNSSLEDGKKLLLKHEFNFYAFAWWLKKAQEIDCSKIMVPSITCLILGGDLDPSVPFSAFFEDERFNKKNIIVKKISGAYHFPWLDNPKEVQNAFEQLIQALR